jgi:uncharacterized protein
MSSSTPGFFANLMEPWPWYVSGPLIGLTVPLLLLLAGKPLGISSNLRHLVCLALPKTRIEYFARDAWRAEFWNILFAAGLVAGGFLATRFLTQGSVALLPAQYHSLRGAVVLLGGGFLVGFGTRYGNGCTSGHAITGLSNLSLTSLYATLSFFGGGLVSAGILHAWQRFFH